MSMLVQRKVEQGRRVWTWMVFAKTPGGLRKCSIPLIILRLGRGTYRRGSIER